MLAGRGRGRSGRGLGVGEGELEGLGVGCPRNSIDTELSMFFVLLLKLPKISRNFTKFRVA
jgi:hypothetical protein